MVQNIRFPVGSFDPITIEKGNFIEFLNSASSIFSHGQIGEMANLLSSYAIPAQQREYAVRQLGLIIYNNRLRPALFRSPFAKPIALPQNVEKMATVFSWKGEMDFDNTYKPEYLLRFPLAPLLRFPLAPIMGDRYILVISPPVGLESDLVEIPAHLAHRAFRAFIGQPGGMMELRVHGYTRYKDGGTTRINTEIGEIYVPTPFKPEAKPTLTRDGSTIELTKIDLYKQYGIDSHDENAQSLIRERILNDLVVNLGAADPVISTSRLPKIVRHRFYPIRGYTDIERGIKGISIPTISLDLTPYLGFEVATGRRKLSDLFRDVVNFAPYRGVLYLLSYEDYPPGSVAVFSSLKPALNKASRRGFPLENVPPAILERFGFNQKIGGLKGFTGSPSGQGNPSGTPTGIGGLSRAGEFRGAAPVNYAPYNSGPQTTGMVVANSALVANPWMMGGAMLHGAHLFAGI